MKAHDRILECVAKVFRDERMTGIYSDEDLKKLVHTMLPKVFLIVSDMQFDSAATNGYGEDSSYDMWKPMHGKLVDLYAHTGMNLIGEPLKLPTMVYWNARTTGGSPVVTSTPDALFVSGYSTNIFKTFMTSGLEGLQNFTPWSYLKKTLMDEWYDDAEKGHISLPIVGR